MRIWDFFSRAGDAVFAAELTLQLYVKSCHLAGMYCSRINQRTMDQGTVRRISTSVNRAQATRHAHSPTLSV